MNQEAASELYEDPAFEPGDKVRAVRAVRNDGTYPGVAVGGFLIEGGDVGYVKSVGTYLNRFYVYAIDFVDRGVLVGMRRHELELLEAAP
ncbi:nitrogen fixation protein NifZ [Magnetospirillum sp. UT-4]|uniref:nitrogen fixation protein NifZ n=1 Tax=Magnetospirillum sp. UT-4 TaxID=2681467 RepID=UPI00137ED2E2|nr:nitrogen fixation protein NifZ [Magnetospirillum sp. UT-4]CAA7618087.1 NifZ [Magnetospirillum sp. UT-4]